MTKNFRQIMRHIKKYKFHSVFLKQFLAILLIVALPLAIITFMLIFYYEKSVTDEVKYTSSTELSRIAEGIDGFVQTIDGSVYSILSDSNVQLFMMDSNARLDNGVVYTRTNAIKSLLNAFVLANGYLDTVYLYSEKNQIVIGNQAANTLENYSDQGWLASYQAAGQTTLQWVEIRDKPYTGSTITGQAMTFYYVVNTYGENEGVLIVNVPVESMRGITKTILEEDEGRFYIVDEENTVLYSTIREEIGSPFQVRDSDQFGVLEKMSDVNNWKYIYEYSDHVKMNSKVILLFIGLWLLVCLIAVFIAYLFSLRTYKPLADILAEMERYNMVVTAGGTDEYKFISTNLLQAFSSLKEAEAELEGKLNQLKRSQMVALQSQINPHFLFNTLEIINLKAAMLLKGENEVSDMIGALSRLLRLGLETQDNMTTVEREVTHAKTYVELLKVRYRDKIQVIWNITPEILQKRVCKMILQPLIENAVEHGIKGMTEPGHIWVSGKQQDGRVILTVADDGRGMTAEQLQTLTQRLNSREIRENENIGLSNVNQRVKLILGEKYGLTVSSNEMGGITVTLSLPDVE